MQGHDFIPTRGQRIKVREAAKWGVPLRVIASSLNIGVPCLKRHFKRELELPQYELVCEVANSMATVALNPDHPQCVNAGKFILDRRGGESWKDKRNIEDDEGERQIVINVNGGLFDLPNQGGLLALPPSMSESEEVEI